MDASVNKPNETNPRFVVRANKIKTRRGRQTSGFLVFDTKTQKPFAAVVPDAGPMKHVSSMWRKAHQIAAELNDFDTNQKAEAERAKVGPHAVLAQPSFQQDSVTP